MFPYAVINPFMCTSCSENFVWNGCKCLGPLWKKFKKKEIKFLI